MCLYLLVCGILCKYVLEVADSFSSHRLVGDDVSHIVQGEIRDIASRLSQKGHMGPDWIQHLHELDHRTVLDGE